MVVLTPVRQLILEVVPFSFQFKAFAAVFISTKKVICKGLDVVLSIFYKLRVCNRHGKWIKDTEG